MTDLQKKRLGYRVVTLMAQKDIGYPALAKYIGVSKQSISNICHGKTTPTLDHIMGMADYFGVTTDYILGREIHDGQ